jgi:putative transposase
MVRPETKRLNAQKVIERFSVSKRRACRILSLHLSTYFYRPLDRGDAEVCERMKELAVKYRRFGRPRIHDQLRKAGFKINHKKTARLYRKLALQLKYRKGKKRINVVRLPRPKPTKPNEVWSIDFVHDRLENGRRLKILTTIDDFTKATAGLYVDTSITGHHLVRWFDTLKTLPKRIRCDNGPEFWSKAFLGWAEHNKIEIEFIDPGKPNQNAFIESFNARFRDECLNENIFFDPNHARGIVLKYENFYNHERPHSSLGFKTPKEFGEEYEHELTR